MLIKEVAFGEAIINPDYSADALAAAIALHEGFWICDLHKTLLGTLAVDFNFPFF